jgi:hypothetical protein
MKGLNLMFSYTFIFIGSIFVTMSSIASYNNNSYDLCSLEYNPVCGYNSNSNGEILSYETYPNECLFYELDGTKYYDNILNGNCEDLKKIYNPTIIEFTSKPYPYTPFPPTPIAEFTSKPYPYTPFPPTPIAEFTSKPYPYTPFPPTPIAEFTSKPYPYTPFPPTPIAEFTSKPYPYTPFPPTPIAEFTSKPYPYTPFPEMNLENQSICSLEYNPVCGYNKNQFGNITSYKTYSNECNYYTQEGSYYYKIMSYGSCERASINLPNIDNICINEYPIIINALSTMEISRKYFEIENKKIQYDYMCSKYNQYSTMEISRFY